MILLAVETSCDETAASVVRDGRDVLSNVIYSQIARHCIACVHMAHVPVKYRIKLCACAFGCFGQ